MVKVDGLDIPDGLLALFLRALQINATSEITRIIKATPLQNWTRKQTLLARSLFVRWQSLYDGFDAGRKTAWTTYWGTLPFGSHSGAGGWPGSGYSAFVYVNAPRYRDGLDLLLDPPGGYTLVLDFPFTSDLEGWDVGAGIPGDEPFWQSGHVHFESADGMFMDYPWFTAVDNLFRIEFDLVVVSASNFIVTMWDDVQGYGHMLMDEPPSTGHYSFDFAQRVSLDDLEFALESGEIDLDNVQLWQGPTAPLLPELDVEILDYSAAPPSDYPWNSDGVSYSEPDFTFTAGDGFIMYQFFPTADWDPTLTVHIEADLGGAAANLQIYFVRLPDFTVADEHDFVSSDGHISYDVTTGFFTDSPDDTMALVIFTDASGATVSNLSVKRTA